MIQYALLRLDLPDAIWSYSSRVGGTSLGSFIPTVKISTNTPLAELKKNWIDFNAGKLLEGVSMDNLLDEFIDFILKAASGEKVMNEKNSFKEIAIWKIGSTESVNNFV